MKEGSGRCIFHPVMFSPPQLFDGDSYRGWENSYTPIHRPQHLRAGPRSLASYLNERN